MDILTKNDPRTYAIIGAAMEVHRQLGCGFLDPICGLLLSLRKGCAFPVAP